MHTNSLGVVLDDGGQPLDADVLEVVAVGADEAADAGGGGVQQHRVGVDGGHRLHHLVHCVEWTGTLEHNKPLQKLQKLQTVTIQKRIHGAKEIFQNQCESIKTTVDTHNQVIKLRVHVYLIDIIASTLTDGVADVDAGVCALHDVHEHLVHALAGGLVVLAQQGQHAQQVHLLK